MPIPDPLTISLASAVGWGVVHAWAHAAGSAHERRYMPLTLFFQAVVTFALGYAAVSHEYVASSKRLREIWHFSGPVLAGALWLAHFAGPAVSLAGVTRTRRLPLLHGRVFEWAGGFLAFAAAVAFLACLGQGAFLLASLPFSLIAAGLGITQYFGRITLLDRAIIVGHFGLKAELERRLLVSYDWPPGGALCRVTVQHFGFPQIITLHAPPDWPGATELREWLAGAVQPSV